MYCIDTGFINDRNNTIHDKEKEKDALDVEIPDKDIRAFRTVKDVPDYLESR